MYIKICKKRINTLKCIAQFDYRQIQIGVPVLDNEDELVGLSDVGDIVLPSGNFGNQCRKNAYGYKYADKTKPKENRIVSTNYIYPYGNTNASKKPVDIERKCYPLVEVSPYDIQLFLYKNSDTKYVLVDITENIRVNYLKEAINLLLEIYGYCYIFSGEIRIDNTIVRKNCNWEILPPGELPSRHMTRQIDKNQNVNDFDIFRLEYIEKHNPTTCVQGTKGFQGYYAYLFNSFCVLESAFYGNATYIIEIDNWEELSKKSKTELINTDKVIDKIIHRENWIYKITKYFSK